MPINWINEYKAFYNKDCKNSEIEYIIRLVLSKKFGKDNWNNLFHLTDDDEYGFMANNKGYKIQGDIYNPITRQNLQYYADLLYNSITRDGTEDWIKYLAKYTPAQYSSDYTICENAVADRLGLQVITRKSEGEWEGTTYVTFSNLKGKVITIKYYWGSCAGCDTLQANGYSAGCQMIYNEYKEVEKLFV